MSDNWGFEGNDSTNLDPSDMNGPKALREAYAKQKERNDALEAKFNELQKDLRNQKVATVFNELGVPGAASLYQGDADPEQIKQWTQSMQSVFGGTGAPAPTTSVDTPPLMGGDQAAQFQQMQEAGTQGVPLGNVEAAYGRVNDATDIQGLLNAFKSMG